MTVCNFLNVFGSVMALFTLIFAIIGTVVKKKGKLKSWFIIKIVEIITAVLCDLSCFCLIFLDREDTLVWLLITITWIILTAVSIQEFKRIKTDSK